MTAGLPGTGIGGLFYMLSALWLPFRELALLARGRSSAARWRLVALQVAIAAGVVATGWATGWLLLLVLPVAWLHENPLGLAPVLLQGVMLALVVAAVHALRFVVGRRGEPPAAAAAVTVFGGPRDGSRTAITAR